MLGKYTIKDNGTSGSGLLDFSWVHQDAPVLESAFILWINCFYFYYVPLIQLILCFEVLECSIKGNEFTTKGVFEAIYPAPCPFPDSCLGIREPNCRLPVWITFFIKITITHLYNKDSNLCPQRPAAGSVSGVGPELSPHCADYPVT